MFLLSKDFGFVIVILSLSTENCHSMKGILFARVPSFDILQTPYFTLRKAESMTDCAAKCLHEFSKSCVYFLYNKDDSLCKINSTILWKENVNPASNWHYYGECCLFPWCFMFQSIFLKYVQQHLNPVYMCWFTNGMYILHKCKICPGCICGHVNSNAYMCKYIHRYKYTPVQTKCKELVARFTVPQPNVLQNARQKHFLKTFFELKLFYNAKSKYICLKKLCFPKK